LPLPAPLKVAVSPEPGTVFGFQLVAVAQKAFIAPVQAALAKGARGRPPSGMVALLSTPVRAL
jgi:hypothetical protein